MIAFLTSPLTVVLVAMALSFPPGFLWILSLRRQAAAETEAERRVLAEQQKRRFGYFVVATTVGSAMIAAALILELAP
ncbi:MAG: hypothetical protein AAFZ09_01530 [Pseudomonadota bacterium]